MYQNQQKSNHNHKQKTMWFQKVKGKEKLFWVTIDEYKNKACVITH